MLFFSPCCKLCLCVWMFTAFLSFSVLFVARVFPCLLAAFSACSYRVFICLVRWVGMFMSGSKSLSQPWSKSWSNPPHPVRDSSPYIVYKNIYMNIRFGGHGWHHICRTANLGNGVFEIWYGIRVSGVFNQIRLVAAVWLRQFSAQIITKFDHFLRKRLKKIDFGPKLRIRGAG